MTDATAATTPAPGSWSYGVRPDGSIWLSLGDPTVPGTAHEQFDFEGSEENARRITAIPELLKACQSVMRASIVCPEDLAAEVEECQAAIAKAGL